MCEIPSNVLLADQFLDLLDGYSIGSNDLTQVRHTGASAQHFLSRRRLTSLFLTLVPLAFFFS